MSEVSGVKLEFQSQAESFYNNHEWGMIVRYRLKDSEMNALLKQYDFKNVSGNIRSLQLLQDIEDEETLEKLSKSEFLRLYEDCKPGNSWSLLIEESQNTFWIELLYPDNGGDIGDCIN